MMSQAKPADVKWLWMTERNLSNTMRSMLYMGGICGLGAGIGIGILLQHFVGVIA